MCYYPQTWLLPKELLTEEWQKVTEEKVDYARLAELIRRIAREEAWQIMDEHLDDYEHKEKPSEDA
jgi:hypothetical protein